MEIIGLLSSVLDSLLLRGHGIACQHFVRHAGLENKLEEI